MELNEYQRLAARTMNPKLNKIQTEHHAVLGLNSEAGEVAALYQKELQGHTIHKEDVMKELGDVLWMIAELCTNYDIDLEQIARMNIDKLRARYPDGFDPERSINRKE